MSTSHYENRDVASHVVQKKIEGILSHSEAHGVEIPGHITAAADAARESAFLFGLLWLVMTLFAFPTSTAIAIFTCFATALLVWKTGRSAWLGWSRLSRLHRLIAQEKYEIEHHRDQEKEELTAMYRLKGFEGKLLEDVIDVLAADGDRLLKVMLEEELGLTLEAHQHPLKQAFGAFVGVLISTCLTGMLLFFLPQYGMLIASILVMSVGALISAIYEKNSIISSLVWNLSLSLLSFGVAYFLINLIII